MERKGSQVYLQGRCIGCGLCVKVCEDNAITMVDRLPVFDYDKCINCKNVENALKMHTHLD